LANRWAISEDGVEGPTGEHFLSKAGHNGVGLHVKIPEHGPTVPSTQKANAAAVDTGAEKRHGTCGAHATYGDIFRSYAETIAGKGCL
jgi:hypothetical protein